MLKFAIALLALPVGAAFGQTTDASSPTRASASPEKSICRRMTVTGSIWSTKVCHTQAQWATLDRASDATMQNRRTSNTIDRAQGGAGGHTDTFGQ